MPKNLLEFLNQIKTPLLVFDLKDCKFSYFNPEALELLGYDEGDQENLMLEKLFKEDNLKRVDSMLRLFESKDNESFRENKIKIRRKSGRNLSVNVIAQRFPGTKSQILLTLNDITEIENLHKQQRETMNQLSQISHLADLGHLAGGIAHEINNPLATIKLCTETLEILISQNDAVDDLAKQQIGVVYNSVDRISGITKQMRRLVQQREVSAESIDLNETTQSLLALYKQRASKANIEILANYPDFSVDVHVDRNKIEQVLFNILNNAIYAVEKNEGEKKIEVSISVDNDFVEVQVTNNGPEIPKKTQKHIFSPFFTDKPVGEGTGLGLSICHNVVKNHGGELSFTSTPESTCFKIKLKCLQKKESAA